MSESRFIKQLNEQVGHEFDAHQQYVAAAVYYDSETLPRLATFFYAQALEERGHAMMMVKYLLDSDNEVRIPGIQPPKNGFSNVVEPVQLALEQEKRVTKLISALAMTAREEGDLAGEQFMQWFIKEQVEEVATMSELLAVVKRAQDNPLLIEDYLVREHPGDAGGDPTAPTEAG